MTGNEKIGKIALFCLKNTKNPDFCGFAVILLQKTGRIAKRKYGFCYSIHIAAVDDGALLAVGRPVPLVVTGT